MTATNPTADSPITVNDAPADLPPDPGVLGIPMFTLATLALGLATLGYVPPASGGGVLPIIVGASGAGQFAAAIWAMGLRDTISAAFSGVFATFWLSYAALGLGSLHGWYGIQPADAEHVEGLFLVAWTIVFFLLLVATFRLPRTITTLLISIVLTGIALIVGTVAPTEMITKASGIGLLLIAAHGAYMFVNSVNVACGGRGLPQGPPMIS